jgi:hypothetical protein
MSTVEAKGLRTHDTAHRPGHHTVDLFSPYRLGELELGNRMVLSPMTRSRAVDGNVPNPMAATYYASALPRASLSPRPLR